MNPFINIISFNLFYLKQCIADQLLSDLNLLIGLSEFD